MNLNQSDFIGTQEKWDQAEKLFKVGYLHLFTFNAVP